MNSSEKVSNLQSQSQSSEASAASASSNIGWYVGLSLLVVLLIIGIVWVILLLKKYNSIRACGSSGSRGGGCSTCSECTPCPGCSSCCLCDSCYSCCTSSGSYCLDNPELTVVYCIQGYQANYTMQSYQLKLLPSSTQPGSYVLNGSITMTCTAFYNTTDVAPLDAMFGVVSKVMTFYFLVETTRAFTLENNMPCSFIESGLTKNRGTVSATFDFNTGYQTQYGYLYFFACTLNIDAADNYCMPGGTYTIQFSS